MLVAARTVDGHIGSPNSPRSGQVPYVHATCCKHVLSGLRVRRGLPPSGGAGRGRDYRTLRELRPLLEDRQHGVPPGGRASGKGTGMKPRGLRGSPEYSPSVPSRPACSLRLGGRAPLAVPRNVSPPSKGNPAVRRRPPVRWPTGPSCGMLGASSGESVRGGERPRTLGD